MSLSSVPDLVEEIRRGRMVILMDDEDRENEGDLIIAAEAVTPEIINFFASEACGLICMPMTRERAQQLQLPLMVRDNRSQHETNFTVSIDAAEQLAPGISAVQRAHTAKVAAGVKAGPADIRTPGHIFPLVAKPGGVLRRAGHTEAGVDLARMAGFEPAALIVEIMNEDGTMARRAELETFAEKHQLRMGTIADLIAYRSRHEHSVELVSTKPISTDLGEFTLHSFRDLVDETLHFALTVGELSAEAATPVRVQSIELLRDTLGTQLDGDGGWNLRRAMARIASEGLGAVVLIGRDTPRETILEGIDAFPDEVATPSPDSPGRLQNYRIIGTGAQILQRLGIGRMRLMSSPLRFNALSGFKLEVVDFLQPGD